MHYFKKIGFAALLCALMMALSITAFATEDTTTSWIDHATAVVTPVSDVYTIDSAEDLAWVAVAVQNGNNFYGKTLILEADINLADHLWTPIGGNGTGKYFSGTFEGNGHTISNMTIVASAEKVGLFGEVNEGIVRNLGLVDVDVSNTDSYTGGLIGYGNEISLISDCYVTGSVIATNIKDSIGGFIGYFKSSDGNIANCYAAVKLTTSAKVINENIGGFIGYFSTDKGCISSCYATGDVENSVDDEGNNIGGFIGYAKSEEGEISNCYATGNVKNIVDDEEDSIVGGFIGYYTGNYSSDYVCKLQ